MSLFWRLFVSHLVVVISGALVIGVATAAIAPVTFADHVVSMRDMMNGAMSASMLQLEQDLDQNFRQAVNSALLVASLAAIVAAGIASYYVSRRIIRPIRATVHASRRIAAGYYDERLAAYSADELGELAHSFNRMAAALAETEKLRQQLIADISHELKTPLASISGYMEGLQDGMIFPSAETFEGIQRETARMGRLVRDLQELSRAEAGAMSLDVRPCDAGELAQSAADWLRPQFVDQQIELMLQPPPQPFSLRADHDRIRQVLLNLLGNALQYTPAGGRVTLSWERAGEMARFSARDTGIGLTAEDQERVFLRFYRVDKSRSRVSGGSGIGLTIARHIVRAHGGEIWAESAGPGKGTTFSFTLPLA